MKHLLAAVVTCSLTSTLPAYAEPLAGYDQFTVGASDRNGPIAASIWYPVSTPTYRGLVGDNGVFKGTSASIGAAIADGKHPLVVLSHGSGGNMDGLGWLSSQLALRGAMVLAVNHPGSTTGDSSPRRSIRLDERAADLRAALDTLLSDPNFAPHIDTKRITSLGFSLGGATALNLAGARLERGLYKDYCTRFQDQADCVFLSKGGVDLAQLPETFESDMHDSRIASAIAIDPAFTYAFAIDSIAGMKLPVLLLNLGGAERWKAIDVTEKGSNLLKRLPDAHYAAVEPGHHFTFLAECKPDGPRLLAEENDDPVCDDPAGTDRAHAHAEIIDRITAFLQL